MAEDVVVTAGPKSATVQLSADVAGIDTTFKAWVLTSVKAERTSASEIVISGEFHGSAADPTFVKCTRVNTGDLPSRRVAAGSRHRSC